MAAKVAASKPAATKKATPPQHPPYKEMIKEAILALKERNGSSRPALKKYIKANYKGVDTDRFDGLFNQAIKRGGDAKEFSFPKGPSGTVKLAKKEPAPKPATTKKPAAVKTAAKAGAKKVPTKKPSVKKAPAADKEKATPKKAAAKPKANAKKPRKESAATTTEKPATLLTKTKSGRVSKGTAASKPSAKASKKATPKKKASPKKSVAAA